ncbi:MAG: cysteine hydrolase [Candidatus Aminicenantes bacterium]|nr:MAG: cysteine hydrolase [Candidatus Aminicenantes bacterium]
MVGFSLYGYAGENKEDTALLLIDIQDFYFLGGRSELVDPEAASLNAKKLLQKFREKKKLVVHVRHITDTGGEIHKNVYPIEGEKVVSKNHVNCFKDTDLLEYLREHKIKKLVICGMMTHMCVEAAVRAAHDYDFETILIHDACATRALTYGDREIGAADVHMSTLSSLNRYYSRVLDTEIFLKDF